MTTGSGVVQFVDVFRSDRYQEVSLANWLSHVPPQLVAQHLNMGLKSVGHLA